MSEAQIGGYVPGAIGRIVELHGTYYSRHWGFGLFFEAKVARELSEFLGRYDPARDGFWTVNLDGRVEGSVTMDALHAEAQGVHLRWFILSSVLRGRGFGNKLLEKAVRFCREKGYGRAYLWTFEGLDAARHLYEKYGFRLAEQHEGTQWGTRVKEQKFVTEL